MSSPLWLGGIVLWQGLTMLCEGLHQHNMLSATTLLIL